MMRLTTPTKRDRVRAGQAVSRYGALARTRRLLNAALASKDAERLFEALTAARQQQQRFADEDADAARRPRARPGPGALPRGGPGAWALAGGGGGAQDGNHKSRVGFLCNRMQ